MVLLAISLSERDSSLADLHGLLTAVGGLSRCVVGTDLAKIVSTLGLWHSWQLQGKTILEHYR